MEQFFSATKMNVVRCVMNDVGMNEKWNEVNGMK